MQQAKRQQPQGSVVVCSPHELTAGGIAGILADAGYEILSQPTSVDSCIESLSGARPDVVLLDGCLVGDHWASIKDLVSQGHTVAILIGPERPGSLMLGAMLAGARGCLSSDEAPEQFIESVALVAKKSMVISPTAVPLLLAEVVAGFTKRNQSLLTDREQTVAVLVSEGRSNREIADVVGLSEHTIKAEVARILSKLGLANRQQLAVYVVRTGLTATFTGTGMLKE